MGCIETVSAVCHVQLYLSTLSQVAQRKQSAWNTWLPTATRSRGYTLLSHTLHVSWSYSGTTRVCTELPFPAPDEERGLGEGGHGEVGEDRRLGVLFGRTEVKEEVGKIRNWPLLPPNEPDILRGLLRPRENF